MAGDLSRTKPAFVSPVEELIRSDRGTCGQGATEGLAWREPQHPEPPIDAGVGPPADVERDLARILARALVQQFRADVASAVGSNTAADADRGQGDATHERRTNQG